MTQKFTIILNQAKEIIDRARIREAELKMAAHMAMPDELQVKTRGGALSQGLHQHAIHVRRDLQDLCQELERIIKDNQPKKE